MNVIWSHGSLNGNLSLAESGNDWTGTITPDQEFEVKQTADNSKLIAYENVGGTDIFLVETDSSGNGQFSFINSSGTTNILLNSTNGDITISGQIDMNSGNVTEVDCITGASGGEICFV